MFSFKLSPEQILSREMAGKFCQKELEPKIDKLEKGEETIFPLIKRFLQEVLGTSQIESLSDLEEWVKARDFITSNLVSIEVSKSLPGFALSMGASLELCFYAILASGTQEQKIKYALPLVRGDKIGSWALTEPEAGSDIRAMKTSFRKEGGDYILNGQKTFITNAPVADIFVVYANSERGFSGFILERGMAGLETSPAFEKMGMLCSPTGAIYLDNVRVPKENVLGKEGDGLFDAFRVLTNERTVSPALMIGIMERALEEATKYAKQRMQFGKPIIKFQAVQFILARSWEKLLASYALLWMLGQMADAGLDTTQVASSAKLFTSESATQCALDAVQILGGYGYIKEAGVERLVRDAKLMEIGAGTSQIQLLILARKLMESEQIELNPMFFGPSPFEKIG